MFFFESHWNELFRFSRRSEESCEHWAARHGYNDRPKEILEKAKKSSKGRYLLDTTISAIESVKKLLKYAEKNPSEKEEKLSECISKLSDAQSDLEMKIRRYVNEIEKVDNRTGMAFFVRAKVDIGKVDANVELATAALRSYIEAANLLAFIGVKKGVDVETFLDSTERYIESLRDNKSISLMAAYDKMKDDTYWNSLNILNSVDGIRTISDELIELIEDSDDEVDLENDIVF